MEATSASHSFTLGRMEVRRTYASREAGREKARKAETSPAARRRRRATVRRTAREIRRTSLESDPASITEAISFRSGAGANQDKSERFCGTGRNELGFCGGREALTVEGGRGRRRRRGGGRRGRLRLAHLHVLWHPGGRGEYGAIVGVGAFFSFIPYLWLKKVTSYLSYLFRNSDSYGEHRVYFEKNRKRFVKICLCTIKTRQCHFSKVSTNH